MLHIEKIKTRNTINELMSHMYYNRLTIWCYIERNYKYGWQLSKTSRVFNLIYTFVNVKLPEVARILRDNTDHIQINFMYYYDIRSFRLVLSQTTFIQLTDEECFNFLNDLLSIQIPLEYSTELRTEIYIPTGTIRDLIPKDGKRYLQL
jgi:hypothetical protein